MHKLRIAPTATGVIDTQEPAADTLDPAVSADTTLTPDIDLAASVDSMAADSVEPQGPQQAERLGHILVELGRLQERQVDAVLTQQAQTQQRFGDLAIALGMVERGDIDIALARQFGVEFFPATEAGTEAQVLPRVLGGAQTEALRAVRSQLVLRWFGTDLEQHTLAVLSHSQGDGRSHVCAHLAVMLSQMDEDTLVIDADLHKPSIHRFFEVDNRIGLTQFLSGQIARVPVRAVRGKPRLHVLPAGAVQADSQSLLERRQFAQLLHTLSRRYAFILIDTPPAGQYSEAVTVAVRASGCLLVTRRNRTRMADAQRLSDQLTRHSVEVLGAVINER